jgi:hypothetical protein
LPVNRTRHRSGRTLGHEITLVLALKFTALALLWFAFFRAPVPADPQQLVPAHPPQASESKP